MAGEKVLPIEVAADLRAHTIVIPIPDSVFDDDGSGASTRRQKVHSFSTLSETPLLMLLTLSAMSLMLVVISP